MRGRNDKSEASQCEFWKATFGDLQASPRTGASSFVMIVRRERGMSVCLSKEKARNVTRTIQ